MTETGHNSAATGVARDQLRSIVERIEALERDKAEIAADIREIYAEAKGNGLRREGFALHRATAQA